ncbi:hypothetical protein [Pseudoflavonifractor phocaeensis]|uniref:hypothetical protein n=1 Tax=Pseudoflavonifractor phocaeensis TaxID=1870988 RepID=UPI0021096494|nr:hypothetical protein [Pseudoflavonifractor phocaeensis]MCQ4862693.1 hypothetical protein [Pseudoflavonifractor phocaeensis]
MYIYPDDLKAHATLALWVLRDVAVIGVGALLSILALVQAAFPLPLVLTAVYAFLTIRVEDTCILDFIRAAAAYFFCPQSFEWRG